MFRRLVYFFVQGLLFVVPLALTLYVVVNMLRFIDRILPELLPFEFWLPGIGLLILIVGITVIGFLGNTVIANPINFWFNKLLEKAPSNQNDLHCHYRFYASHSWREKAKVHTTRIGQVEREY
jgi:uncharacterized membrane protein